MTKESMPWQSWGVQPHEEMKHRVSPFECPHCWYSHMNWWELFVGFSDEKEEYKKSTWSGYPMAGVVVMECPSCFELSWCHIDEEKCHVGWLERLSVPNAKEAYGKMLERVKAGQVKGEDK